MRMRLMRGFDLVQAWICGLVPRVWQGMGALECSLVHMLTSWTCPALDSKSRVVMGTVLQNVRCKLMAGQGAGSSWLSLALFSQTAAYIPRLSFIGTPNMQFDFYHK